MIFGHATVAPNAPPTATNLSPAESYTADTPLNLIDIVASDVDSANVTATLTLSNTAAGALSTATSGAVTSTYVPVTGVWTASDAIADVNALLAGVVFTPTLNFNGSFSIATSVSDGALSVTGSKAFTGIPVDDAPVAVSDKVSTPENVTGVFAVIANDTDVDGGPKQIVNINGTASPAVGQIIALASGATVSLRADGGVNYNPNGAFNYLISAATAAATGAVNSSAVDSFTYALNGGSTATTNVIVTGVDGVGDQLRGNNAANTITGTAAGDVILTYDGNDTLRGGLGADTLIGGNGIDTASYDDDFGAVFVNLTLGAGSGNAAQGDTYSSIENVIGSVFNDTLIGDAGINRLDGGGGNDVLIGALGPDVLVGGAGIDTASYGDNQGSVFVNLTLGRGYNNAAEGDTYEGIENVLGGLFNDVLIGDDQANRLDGAMGADLLIGAGGADTFVFAHAPGATSPFGSPNVDNISDFASGIDKIELSKTAFAALNLGALSASAFTTGTTATTADHRVLYDQATGNLFYDADGSGSGAAVLFAVLDNRTAITANDFIIA